jgi:hypothetical protein
MTVSLILACAWAVVANVLAMIPSRDDMWTRAYVLIAFGIPLVGFVTYQNGPWVGLFVLFAGMSVLRWPVRYMLNWVRHRGARTS